MLNFQNSEIPKSLNEIYENPKKLNPACKAEVFLIML